LNDALAIRERLAETIDLVIDAGPCPALPTTVIDLAQTPPAIVRLGRGDPADLGLGSVCSSRNAAGRVPGRRHRRVR
jgi:tRNA A37 threonylcarbamoyladenosine synthetase subunit TsaC/SUA5/YrdC